MTRKNFKAAEPRTSRSNGATKFELAASLLSKLEEGLRGLESANTKMDVGLISDSSFEVVNDMVCRATLLDSASLSSAWRLKSRLTALNARLVAAAAFDCNLEKNQEPK